jgi:pimeloyl-ACP methyl ester carboxylesterase
MVVLVFVGGACNTEEVPDANRDNLKFSKDRPGAGENNVWYQEANSQTALVFVHGILGDSRGTWLYARQSSPAQYWPDLVANDNTFASSGVFLGGYYTAVDSQLYDVRNAADELLGGLRRTGALNRQNILFVCHSTGGIVVRYLLYHNREQFADKRIGLLLIASPSYGSKLADISPLDYLLELYNNKMGSQLRWNNVFLEELDGNFKNLVNNKLLPNLVGREAVENHFIVHRKWLPNRWLVVEEQSGGRYFARAIRLRDTDHFSAVKPDGAKHPAYELLADFYTNDFTSMIVQLAEARIRELQTRVVYLYGLYESAGTPGSGSEAWRMVARESRSVIERMKQVDDGSLRSAHGIAKYEYLSFAYALAASVETRVADARQLADQSLSAADEALKRIGSAMQAAASGNVESQKVTKWLEEGEDENRIGVLVVIARAIKSRGNDDVKSERQAVELALSKVDPQYAQRFPPDAHPDVRRVLRVAK